MFKFFTILCLVGLATAANFGYNYQSAVSSQTPVATGIGNIKTVQPAASAQHLQTAPSTVDFVKHFYYFSAPEEKLSQREVIQHAASTPVQKKLNVVVIKAPENHSYQKAVQQLVPSATNEQRTQIYVLNKEPSHAASVNQHRQVQYVQPVQHVQHKPEVHFIKYQTSDDVQRIQQNILQQYGISPGQVHTVTAPVVNFVGSSTPGKSSYQTAATNVNRAYLAPNTKVDNNYAKNFLPNGVDVVPGSSYLPPALVL
ncbi:uncharacterized protein LOC119678950 [Teleopsis dalmanni]|uniref:uncharacterized protein LOC119678950 n=1 Tax=Teleopsis dalmanni TaxID=139649 RepID=UPI0018CF9147|nr:uncharacterized protein LOC119678950 [Teleopsis dalmanni]